MVYSFWHNALMVIIDQQQGNFAKIKLQETWEIVSKNPMKNVTKNMIQYSTAA